MFIITIGDHAVESKPKISIKLTFYIHFAPLDSLRTSLLLKLPIFVPTSILSGGLRSSFYQLSGPLSENFETLGYVHVVIYVGTVYFVSSSYDENYDVCYSDYSGSDVATVTLGALFQPIKDLQAAQHWSLNQESKFPVTNSRVIIVSA